MSDTERLMRLMLKDMPVLVTKADVLDHYAGQSEFRSIALRMGQLQAEQAPRDEENRRLNDMWKAAMPAIDLQIAAAEQVTALLRQLAREERILAARAAAANDKREPARGQ